MPCSFIHQCYLQQPTLFRRTLLNNNNNVNKFSKPANKTRKNFKKISNSPVYNLEDFQQVDQQQQHVKLFPTSSYLLGFSEQDSIFAPCRGNLHRTFSRPRKAPFLQLELSPVTGNFEKFLKMASFLLPIIGSPPNSGDGLLSSTPVDDVGIGALTLGMGRMSDPASEDSQPSGDEKERPPELTRQRSLHKKFVLRRKLSTSFDEPVGSLLLGLVAQKASGGGAAVTRPRGSGSGDNFIPGGTWLEEQSRKFHQRISEGSDEDASIDGGSASDGESKSSVDIFPLLEKAIGFHGRNVSHLTVEQCVKDMCTVYDDISDEDKVKFFTLLGEKHGVDHSKIVNLANSLASCEEDQARLNLEEKLRSALIPKYQWLFSQIGRLDNGVKFLVDLRTDVLDAIEKSTESTALLKPLNYCLKELIGVWFGVGFLKLERVTWSSSCEMLQKISEYEAVHPMRNWTDLKKRVGPNRRCFVFTHGSMPNEPVVVLHTALTNHIPSSIHNLVKKKRQISIVDSMEPDFIKEETEDPSCINTAIFYSITSTQRGLTGIELGNYLIKRVVKELQIEFPKMYQFSTLSPIPGFSKWLLGSLKTAQRSANLCDQDLLREDEIEALMPIFKGIHPDKEFFDAFLAVLKLNSWFEHHKLVATLERPLMRLCAHYLYGVKRRGFAMDPVAHFHLKNGAVMWRINWQGDVSPRGLTNSCGMMVNYRYFLEDCEKNSQTYMEQQIIQASEKVRYLYENMHSSL